MPFQTMMMGSVEGVSKVFKKGELFFALALISILVILIVPLHRSLLDMALAASLAFSVMVLMTVLFLENPLEFNVFPTVLLVSTMLRLALNVASTRLILSEGHQGAEAAGQIIKAFGAFIMGGNFIIGLIVFVILVIINFVVITKGSGRIAEVVARFSLDALPGKQMGVDADLASGLIDQAEAKKRRALIQDEINFYGAMDGAAKFVRGDAIAGVLITCVNLVGGMLIGILQKGLSLSHAASSYTLLTVGDGLVAQVPALVVSVAAGMLISKTSSKGTTNQAMLGQFGAYPMALFMSAFFMIVFAIMPGMPLIPFMMLAGLSGFMAWRMQKQQGFKEVLKTRSAEQAGAQSRDSATSNHEIEKSPQEMLMMDEIKLELGVGLVHLIKDPTALLGRIRKMRENLASDFGLVIPTIRIVDNLTLETYTYQLKIKEIAAAKGRILTNKVIAFDPKGTLKPLIGEAGVEPVLGLKGIWIPEGESGDAKGKGYIVADGKALLTTHLTETLKKHLPELLSYQLQQSMIDTLPKAYQKLYSEMVPVQISPATVQRILKNLLEERVSIRDLPTIVEAMAEALDLTKDPAAMTEHVRLALARQMSALYASKEGRIATTQLSSTWAHEFQSALQGEGSAQRLVIPPSRIKAFWDRLKLVYEKSPLKTYFPTPPLLVTSTLRPHVRRLTMKVRPDIAVLSDMEVASEYGVDCLEEI